MAYDKGVNLGGYFSQCVHTKEHYESFISEKDICQIAKWGFDHVRVPMDYEFLEDEEGNPKEEDYLLLERLVCWCRQYGLKMILDLHKTRGYDFNDADKEGKNNLFDSPDLQQHFADLWEELARRFGGKDDIAFELLNEVVNPEFAKPWNQLIRKAVKGIRKVASDTLIIYGGVEWNCVRNVLLLEKPLDGNVMFTFHYYEPLLFTHQKAYWVAAMDPNEDIPYPQDMAWYKEKSKRLGLQGKSVVDSKASAMGMEFHEEMIADAIEYCRQMGVRLYCGEFGVIDRAATEDTGRWFEDVTRLFEKYGIGYALWNYKEKDFGIAGEHYDSVRDILTEDGK